MLAYGLHAKTFIFEFQGHQRSTASGQVNPHPNSFSIGPFVVEFRRDPVLNMGNEINDLLPTFDKLNRVRLTEELFSLRHKKELQVDVLKKLEYDRPSASYSYSKKSIRNESDMMHAIYGHWFEPITTLINSYNNYKTPRLHEKIVLDYLLFAKKMTNVYRVQDHENYPEIEAQVTTECTFTSFGVNSKADLAMDFSFKDSRGDAKTINFMLILEAKMPSTNILKYLKNKLIHEETLMNLENQDDEKATDSFCDTGENNFNTCFSKMLKLLVCSNSTKGIITDYSHVLFMEIEIENGELVLYYSLFDSAYTHNFRYLLWCFCCIENYQDEREKKVKIQDYMLRMLAENESAEPHHSSNQHFWSSGGDSATTTSTTTTDLSLTRMFGDINFESSMTPVTQPNSSDLQEAVKIFGEYPYDPDDIARKFQINEMVLFNYDPKMITTSLHEIVEVKSDILQEFNYDLKSSELETIGSKLIMKLAPLESMFFDVNDAYNSYGIETGGSEDVPLIQKTVNLTFRELKFHLKVLHEVGNTFVHRIFNYGFLLDRTNYAATKKPLNWRFNGSYILMEKIDDTQELTSEKLKSLPSVVKGNIIKYFHSLHSIGIIHNDIKASNLLITSDNVVKIIDFGNSYESDKDSDKTNEMRKVKRMLGV